MRCCCIVSGVPTCPQNDSLATLLARLEGILGPMPEWMLHRGRYAHRFYTRSGMLYERASGSQRYELLLPKRTTLRHRCGAHRVRTVPRGGDSGLAGVAGDWEGFDCGRGAGVT